MTSLALRSLFERKVRLVMSTLAIVLGIGFLTGVLTFSGGLDSTFANIVKGTTPDVTVQLKGLSNEGFGSVTSTSQLTPADLDKLRRLPEFSVVDGQVGSTSARLLDTHGKVVATTGAPTLAFNYTETRNILGTPMLSLKEGRIPTAVGEVTLDTLSAEKAGYAVGDTVSLIPPGDGAEQKVKLVGLVDFTGGGIAGAVMLNFSTEGAQQLFLDGKDAYTSASLTVADGVSQQAGADAANAVLPKGFEALPGDQVAADAQQAISQFTDVMGAFLTTFAVIAVVVGGFIIANTFAILVAQRVRELGLLRAVGASRRQVTLSVILEALLLGLVGTTLGVGLGFGLARLLAVLFRNLGLDIGGEALQLTAATVLTAYVVGTGMTLIAAYLPARRASHIPPIAALREDATLPEGTLQVRAVFGGLALFAGLSAIWLGGFSNPPGNHLIWVGAGATIAVLAAGAISPILGAPLLLTLRGLFRRIFGVTGSLAGENALRNPRRTGATASALMIGLAIVSAIGVLAASLNATIDKQVGESFTADYLVTSADMRGVPTSVGDRIATLPGVGAMARTQMLPALVSGEPGFLTAIDGEYAAINDLRTVEGTTTLRKNEAYVTENWQAHRHLGVGDKVAVLFPGNKQLTITIVGMVADSPMVHGLTVPMSTVAAAGVVREDSTIAVDAAPGTSTAALKKSLDAEVAKLPIVTVQDKAEFAKTAKSQVNMLLSVIYGLLTLAIIIAVLGIINTLGLSVVERTREVGLLRAVGMRRGQVGRMVALESVAIAIMGAILGMALGVGIGVVLRQALEDNLTELGLPWSSLAGFLVVAVVFGVLAAILPAVRASRLRILDAIATE